MPSLSKIRRIPQANSEGCGIACLAMVAGISYRKAVQTVFGNRKKSTHEINIHQLAKSLKKFGFNTKLSNSFKKHNKARAVIIGFMWPGETEGHYIVYVPDEDKFLDPAWDDDDPCSWNRYDLVRYWIQSGRESLVIYNKK